MQRRRQGGVVEGVGLEHGVVEDVDAVAEGDEVVEDKGGLFGAAEVGEEGEEFGVKEVVMVLEAWLDDLREDLAEFVEGSAKFEEDGCGMGVYVGWDVSCASFRTRRWW